MQPTNLGPLSTFFGLYVSMHGTMCHFQVSDIPGKKIQLLVFVYNLNLNQDGKHPLVKAFFTDILDPSSWEGGWESVKGLSTHATMAFVPHDPTCIMQSLGPGGLWSPWLWPGGWTGNPS